MTIPPPEWRSYTGTSFKGSYVWDLSERHRVAIICYSDALHVLYGRVPDDNNQYGVHSFDRREFGPDELVVAHAVAYHFVQEHLTSRGNNED